MITTRHFKASDGLVLNCADYGGEGLPPMLLIHGGGAHARWWDFVAPAFTDRYHVLALDQRGHGESPWTTEWTYGTKQYVADLAAVIDGWELGRPVLVGHSMGGHTVMAYAMDHSEKLRAMIVVDSPASYPREAVEALRQIADRPSRTYETLEDAVANFRTNPPQNMARPEVLQYVARLSFRQDDRGQWGHKMDRRTMMREPISVTKGLSRINCPSLYVRAGSSVMAVEITRKIAATIPNCGHTHVADSYHHVMIDNPSGLIAVMNEFLNGLA